jgi:tetratricopeptide (TPR) repeat protein
VKYSSTLTSVSNLAGVFQCQGKYETAEKVNRRVLERYDKVLGVEYSFTLTSVYNLAYLLQTKKQYEGASALYQRAIEGYQKALGS